MNGVGNVPNFGGPTAAAPIAGGQLTPEAMMMYCASQMRFLDEGIAQQMAKQQTAHNIANLLNDVKTALGKTSMGADSTNEKGRVVDAFERAFEALPPGDTEMRDKLNDAFHDFVTDAYGSDIPGTGNQFNLGYIGKNERKQLDDLAGAGNDKNAVSGDNLKLYSTAVDAISTDLGKGAELDMINLQSLVSQRQMAVQLTTQIISKIDETKLSVVAQIGK